MGITLYGNGNGPYSHGNKFPSADAVFSLCNSNVQFTIIYGGIILTILLHLIETVRFSDKLSTMILYVSRAFDTPKMFMPQRLNDCLRMGMGRMGIAQWESHGNGNWLQNWKWKWEGMGIDHVGIGGNGHAKSHSRSSLL